MPILTSLKSKSSVLTATRGVVDHIIVDLPTGRNIDVHVARYLKSKVKPRLVVFDQQTPLLKWCKQHNIQNAINGGFTMHHSDNLLGEIWTAGKKHNSIAYSAPWHNARGSVHITKQGHITIAPRHHFSKQPSGDLLQAGPLLAHKGQSLIAPGIDPEGISASSDQFDDDWTGDERYPRAAIGANEDFIFCVAVNGYWPDRKQGLDTGLSLGELADLMLQLGATEALNLDGGSNVTLVANEKLINDPRAGITYNYEAYPEGRPIPNAIIFEPVKYT
jgi:exopolysaccharide biosynthesis protein